MLRAVAKPPPTAPAFRPTPFISVDPVIARIVTPEVELEPGRRRSLKLHEKINVATVEFKGKKWHPAFTAPKRISAYLKDPETCLAAMARDLFELLPRGSNFWLNPQSECQKPLPGDEISLLLSGKIFTIDFTGRDTLLPGR